MQANDSISIGQLAERTGVSVSAVRFYEARGLVSASRNAGGQRRFLRSDVRRVAFVLIAQKLGFTIAEIGDQLASLPQGRTPTQADWSQISARFGQVLDERIAGLTAMRDRLDGCIGCGCLSLKACALYNPGDRIAARGPGPRYLLGDRRRKA
ncbi:redox-sensitive transcriptional activator SoxR [Maricaulis sp.]|uniref:redox-sensitive transcriptional activator SoxR n=1 Tax=Maricaulis sp. TaxID=1486257 RepID=UPI003A927366|tara:strand:+ start:2921 stop:3379 length:459 start_codon:yes stop_codon:yes gene_type:complete